MRDNVLVCATSVELIVRSLDELKLQTLRTRKTRLVGGGGERSRCGVPAA